MGKTATKVKENETKEKYHYIHSTDGEAWLFGDYSVLEGDWRNNIYAIEELSSTATPVLDSSKLLLFPSLERGSIYATTEGEQLIELGWKRNEKFDSSQLGIPFTRYTTEYTIPITSLFVSSQMDFLSQYFNEPTAIGIQYQGEKEVEEEVALSFICTGVHFIYQDNQMVFTYPTDKNGVPIFDDSCFSGGIHFTEQRGDGGTFVPIVRNTVQNFQAMKTNRAGIHRMPYSKAKVINYPSLFENGNVKLTFHWKKQEGKETLEGFTFTNN